MSVNNVDIDTAMSEFILPTALDDDRTPYGHAVKEKYFLLDKAYCNLNHGSYGTVPRPVLSRQQQYYLEQESRPDAWFRQNYFQYIKDARAVMAELAGTAIENLVSISQSLYGMRFHSFIIVVLTSLNSFLRCWWRMLPVL